MAVPLPLEGSCRCGRVKVRVTKQPLITAACHCRGCQKMAASAFSLTTMFPADGFEVTEGQTVTGGIHGPQLSHQFCAHCMTWVFTRVTGVDWFVNVRPTMFDNAIWAHPYMETMVSAKLGFAQTGAVESFDEFPPPDDYERLMAAYRAWAG
jgi:hypothetical protein